MSEDLAIFVHGSWMGPWVWTPLIARLQQAGIGCIAPTLIGLDDGPPCPQAGLSAHVAQIVAAIDEVDATTRLALVGHSYGALVVTAAAARRPERVSSVIVIDGPLAEAGRSLLDQTPEIRADLLALVDPAAPAFLRSPPPEFLDLAVELIESGEAVLRPMPLVSHTEPSEHDASALECACYYVGFDLFALCAAMSAKAVAAGWRTTVRSGGHMSIMSQPDIVSELIAPAIRQPRTTLAAGAPS